VVVNVAEPGVALTGDLTMAILRVLDRRSTPATAAQIVRVSRRGTQAGIRRAVQRMALHGIVLTDRVDDRTTYLLNAEHVLYPAVRAMLSAKLTFRIKLRQALAEWEPSPVFAALYGSAARGDGDEDSDVDLWLIRPAMTPAARELWTVQDDELRLAVNRWSGNRLHVVQTSQAEFRRLVRLNAALVDEWRRDLLPLVGDTPPELSKEPV